MLHYLWNFKFIVIFIASIIKIWNPIKQLVDSVLNSLHNLL